jgi:rSAM/selenodomain-associated transferase 2
MQRKGCVCVFAKPPRPGAVKTRLAAEVGSKCAAALASRPDRTLPAHRVSIVMPVLNEEVRILKQLENILAVPGLHEIIVVDGGSRDRTLDLVRATPGVTLLVAPKGRARQMNAGAQAARGDVLLFLHADVRLPLDAMTWIATSLSDPRVVAGAFRTWTVNEGQGRWLSPLLHLADFRSRYTRLPYGDQALFVRADAFRQLGGFPEQPLMEDLELSRRLWRLGLVQTVPATVHVSGRRFLSSPFYYTVLMNIFPALYRLGIPARVLASLYGDPR